MISDAQLEALLKIFEERAQKINLEYLQRMAWHLREVGKIGATDIHRLSIMRQMDANMQAVQKMLARMADLMQEDIEKMFAEVAKQDWQFAQEVMKAPETPPGENARLKAAVNAQYLVTLGAMRNLSRTTVSQEAYQRVLDKAIQAVQGGGTDYASAIRSALKEAAAEGVRVVYSDAAPYSKRIQYASGRTRRLDSAVRQNILDGVRELHQEVMNEAGREFGSDGVEISAHALCAPDHLPYQGRQFDNARFAQIQDSLPRRIGQWNCRHIQVPILMGITEPTYTEERLKEIADYSNEKIEINGKTRTRYQWTQQQRAIEAAVRAQKDIAVAGKAAGDMKLRREAQARINALTKAYDEIVSKAGVAAYDAGMRVEGFRAVKAAEQLKNPEKNDKIESIKDHIKSDAVSKDINPEKQNRHIRESDGYKEGRSYIFGGIEEAQALVTKYHGTGEPEIDKNGNWSHKEIVEVDFDIGANVRMKTSEEERTNRFKIHYSNTGAHVVPTGRKEKANEPD